MQVGSTLGRVWGDRLEHVVVWQVGSLNKRAFFEMPYKVLAVRVLTGCRPRGCADASLAGGYSSCYTGKYLSRMMMVVPRLPAVLPILSTVEDPLPPLPREDLLVSTILHVFLFFDRFRLGRLREGFGQ